MKQTVRRCQRSDLLGWTNGEVLFRIWINGRPAIEWSSKPDGSFFVLLAIYSYGGHILQDRCVDWCIFILILGWKGRELVSI